MSSLYFTVIVIFIWFVVGIYLTTVGGPGSFRG